MRDDAALNLAGRGARDRLGDVDLLRPLEVGQPLRQYASSSASRRPARARRRPPRPLRPTSACGTPKQTASATAGCASSTSSISRGEIFSPPRLISSLSRADQRQIAVCVEKALVAGPEPAVDERRRVGLRIVLVAANDVRPLDDDLAALAGRQCVPAASMMLICDVGAAADRARLARGRRQRIRRHLVRGFGHAVRLEHRRAERRFELVHHLRRQRRAARADEAQPLGARRLRRAGSAARASSSWCIVGTAEYHVTPWSRGDAPERQRVELAGHDDRAAGRERGQRRRDQPVHVEQRHHAQRHVVGSERVAARDVAARRSTGSRARAARASAGRCCRWCAAPARRRRSPAAATGLRPRRARRAATVPAGVHVDA